MPRGSAYASLALAVLTAGCGGRTSGLEDGPVGASTSTTTPTTRPPVALRCGRAKPQGAERDLPTTLPSRASLVSAGLAVVDEGDVVYAYRASTPGATAGGLLRIRGGSAATRVAVGSTEPMAVAATPSRILWSDRVGLHSIATSGGAPLLARAAVTARHLATDDAFAYALVDSTAASGRVVRVSLTNGDERTLAEYPSGIVAAGIAHDATNVYFAYTRPSFLWRVRKDGVGSAGEVQTVPGAPVALTVTQLAFDGTDLFVALSMSSGLLASQIAATNRNSTPGADRRFLPTEDVLRGRATGLFADTSGVYVAYAPTPASYVIERFCADGTFRVELTRGTGAVAHLVADNATLYFSVDDAGSPSGGVSLRSLPK